ncbi:hypothetical protein V8F06_005317 [Rhypophila decipiens]
MWIILRIHCLSCLAQLISCLFLHDCPHLLDRILGSANGKLISIDSSRSAPPKTFSGFLLFRQITPVWDSPGGPGRHPVPGKTRTCTDKKYSVLFW